VFERIAWLFAERACAIDFYRMREGWVGDGAIFFEMELFMHVG